jgi:hypothetical protein
MRSPRAKREKRQERAAARAAAAEGRTPSEQLARLVAAGHGHCAEAARLRAEVH